LSATSTTSPDSAPLAPLLANTDLQDVSTHPKFVGALRSSDECARLPTGSVWGGNNGVLWPIYPTMKQKVH
jgi:hypothetical protein